MQRGLFPCAFFTQRRCRLLYPAQFSHYSGVLRAFGNLITDPVIAIHKKASVAVALNWAERSMVLMRAAGMGFRNVWQLAIRSKCRHGLEDTGPGYLRRKPQSNQISDSRKGNFEGQVGSATNAPVRQEMKCCQINAIFLCVRRPVRRFRSWDPKHLFNLEGSGLTNCHQNSCLATFNGWTAKLLSDGAGEPAVFGVAEGCG